ncbi:hypothetical protein HanIR_Chr02g0056121 [Helianthus annuus]|nr:hypothetical protein HanIR_Chr02g0056121 [Helianthus annuus]
MRKENNPQPGLSFVLFLYMQFFMAFCFRGAILRNFESFLCSLPINFESFFQSGHHLIRKIAIFHGFLLDFFIQEVQFQHNFLQKERGFKQKIKNPYLCENPRKRMQAFKWWLWW